MDPILILLALVVVGYFVLRRFRARRALRRMYSWRTNNDRLARDMRIYRGIRTERELDRKYRRMHAQLCGILSLRFSSKTAHKRADIILEIMRHNLR